MMAWLMSVPNAVAQDNQNCELLCQYMGISPSWQSMVNPQEIEQKKVEEMQMMVVNFRQIKAERKAEKKRKMGGLLLGVAGVLMQDQANRHQRTQQSEQETMAQIQQRQAQITANDVRPRETSRSYANNSLTSRQSSQQYYPVGTTSNGQMETARQMENLAIANGQSRYVSGSEIQQRQSQNEGTTVMGVELTSYGRISHTLKVDYSRSIPRVNAVRINDPQNPSMDAWQYLYIDAQPNRTGTPKECKWYVTIYNRTIYF